MARNINFRRRGCDPLFGAPLVVEPVGSITTRGSRLVALLRAYPFLGDGLGTYRRGTGALVLRVFLNHRRGWLDRSPRRRKMVRDHCCRFDSHKLASGREILERPTV